MSTIPPRSFSCKIEELPVIAGFTAISFERDLPSFTEYSPVFNDEYLTTYKAKITEVLELVQPYSETVEGKLITDHIDGKLHETVTMVNHLEGYVNLAAKTIPMDSADFGLVQLRKSVYSRDLESVLNHFRPVLKHIEQYHTELKVVGMSDEFANRFTEAGASLAEDKNKRYTTISNRAALVQNNMVKLNDLYDQMNEICRTGKILYKQSDKAKLNDYTIAFLLKQVHRTLKPAEHAAKKTA